MRKYIAMLLACMLCCYLSACTKSTTMEASDTPTQPNEKTLLQDNSTAERANLTTLTDEDWQEAVAQTVLEAAVIFSGQLMGVIPTQHNDNPYAIYRFSIHEVLKGDYAAATIDILQPMREGFSYWPFKIGKKYVVSVKLSDYVHWGSIYRCNGIYVELSNEDIVENIRYYPEDSVNRNTEWRLTTTESLKKYFVKLVGERNYAKSGVIYGDNYVHNDNLTEIVHGATGIYKVKLTWQDKINSIYHNHCEVTEVLKGPATDNIRLCAVYALESNEEYIVLMLLDEQSAIIGEYWGVPAARTNSYFPLTDTEKVAEVERLIAQAK